jgi:hypothetical protein
MHAPRAYQHFVDGLDHRVDSHDLLLALHLLATLGGLVLVVLGLERPGQPVEHDVEPLRRRVKPCGEASEKKTKTRKKWHINVQRRIVARRITVKTTATTRAATTASTTASTTTTTRRMKIIKAIQ